MEKDNNTGSDYSHVLRAIESAKGILKKSEEALKKLPEKPAMSLKEFLVLLKTMGWFDCLSREDIKSMSSIIPTEISGCYKVFNTKLYGSDKQIVLIRVDIFLEMTKPIGAKELLMPIKRDEMRFSWMPYIKRGRK